MTTTLERPMDEFEKLLEESFAKTLTVADIVEGTVIRKEQDGYLVCVKGAKTEAFLSKNEIPSDSIDSLEIGDVREFYVVKEENDENHMLLSLKRIVVFPPEVLPRLIKSPA